MNLTSARRLPFLVLAFGLSLLSCGREITGPDGSRLSALALDPRMPMPFAVEGSGSVVPFVKVRVTLERADGTEALERIVDFGADTDTLQLALEVPLPFGTTSAGIPLTLRMQYINAQGDTVFRAGPVIVMAVPLAQGETPSVVSFDVQYVGVGADAAFLDLSPIEGVVVAGTTTTFTGTAYGANENELPGTPIIYSSPDADKVQLSPTGVATWLPVRGSARVIASLPTGIDADTATMTVSLPATRLAIVSGNSQSAAPGSPLSAPLVLRVTASDDVPVEGVTVTFAVFSGGGVVTPLTAISDVEGLVSADWTLGAAVGAQQVMASFAGLAGNEIALTAMAGDQGSTGGLVTWTGAVDFDWSNPGNWSTGAVPTVSDSAVIPAVATQPRLTAPMTMVGAVEVQAGTLWFNDAVEGRSLVTMGDFVTSGSGVLVMQNAGNALVVNGDAVFSGGSEAGLLTAGTISVGGNFTQDGTNSPGSFEASRELYTILQGTSPTVSMTNPGQGPNQSRFGMLSWVGGGTLTQSNGISVTGQYFMLGSTPSTHLGIGGAQGQFLEAEIVFSAAPLTLDNVRLVVRQENPDELSDVALSTIAFRNLPATATQIEILHPGRGYDVSLDNIEFQQSPATALYLVANDNGPTDQSPLVVTVSNSTPATAPAGLTQVINGASIVWPAGIERVWLGSSADWSDAANWLPAGVPGPLDDVVIVSGAIQPVVTSPVSIGTLNVVTGASLSIGSGGSVTVNGDLFADGNVFAPAPNDLQAAGMTRLMRGNVQNLNVTGIYLLDAPLTVSNDLVSRGSLGVNGERLDVGGNLSLLTSGILVMQGASDHVTVAGNILFNGGSTEGLMTNGLLELAGNLVQSNPGGVPPNAFGASGNHITRLIGTGAQSISIENGGAGTGFSHFASLDVSQAVGPIQLEGTDVIHVGGQLVSNPSTGAPTIAAVNGAGLRAAGVFVNGLVLDNVPLTIGGGAFSGLNRVTFQGYESAAVTQLTVQDPGAPNGFVFDQLVFSVTPTSGGFYLRAEDTDGAAPDVLTITLTNANPASPGGFTDLAGGAVVNWGTGAGVRLWTGAADTDWMNGANWVGGIVPVNSVDSARIQAGMPNQPALTENAVVTGLTVEDGAILDLAGFNLAVLGSVVLPATPSVLGGSPLQFRLMASGAATVRGTLPSMQVIGGTYTVDGPMTVNGDIGISATLSVGGSALLVNGSLLTDNGGVFAMSGPADVTVTGNATFLGGSTAGMLTGGTLFVGGTFAQGGTAQSFAAGPGHTVVLNGTTAQSVTFSAPDLTENTACAASCFGTLRSIRGPADGNLTFLSGAKAVTLMELSTPNAVDATGFTLLSGGAPSITALDFTAAKLGFVTGIARNVESFAVDTLIGMGNGLPLPPNLSTPTRLAGSYLINAPHNAELIVSNGALDVSGVASINGTLRLRGNGWLRMQEASDTLTVNGEVFSANTSPALELTAGVLNVNGSFSQSGVGFGGFNPGPAHKTRITGAGALVQMVEPGMNQFGTLEFNTPGATILGSLTVGGDVIVSSVSGPITGGTGQVTTINGGLYDTLGGRWQVPTTVFTGANDILPNTIASNVIFNGDVTLGHDVNFTLGLTVGGSASLMLNGNRVSVLGPFATVADGNVIMTNAADTLSLSGSATFSGGSTAGVMTQGMLELYGDFAQSGNGESFAPSGSHVTWFYGSGPQSVSFAAPGTGPGTSQFNHVGIAQGEEGNAVSLLSDVWAEGSLMTLPSMARRISAPSSQLFHSRGASIGGSANMEFNNVRWALTEGLPVSIDGLRFDNMDPAATQFSIARNGPTVALSNLEFLTVPTGAGLYMQVQDSDGPTNGDLVVAITGVTPASHGGFLNVTGAATVTGWSGTPEFRWTGAVNGDFADPGNWSSGIVPGAADSAYIATAANTPSVMVGHNVRTLVLEAGATLGLGADLTVHGSVDVPPTASITSSDGRLVLSSETGGTVRGTIPHTRVEGGLFALSGDVTITSGLDIYGNVFGGPGWTEGIVSPGDFGLAIAGSLFVGQEGVLTMTGIGVVDVLGDALFYGNNTAGRLTSGSLRLHGSFQQEDDGVTTGSFAASGTHVVEFAGTAQQTINFRSPDVALSTTCTMSCFAGVRSVKGPGEGALVFTTDAKAIAGMSLAAEAIDATGNDLISAGTPDFNTVTLVAGGIAYQTGLTHSATTVTVDSLAAWGTGGAALVGLPGARTVVVGTHSIDSQLDGNLDVRGTLEVTDPAARVNGSVNVFGTLQATSATQQMALDIVGGLTLSGPAARFISSGMPHVVSVGGNATFAGPNSTGDLASGRLRVAGNLSQLNTVSAQSLVAAPGYTVEFTGPGTVSFADPVQSTLGNVEFTATGFSRTLATDMRTTGMVSLNASSFTLAAGGGAYPSPTRRIFADRAESSGLGVTLFNVGITTRAFNSAPGGSLLFTGLDPSVVQLDILGETSALSSSLRMATFATQPTGAGRYVRIVDTTPLDGDAPTLVVQSASPGFHGGLAEAVLPATMTGWAMPEFRWTGAVSGAWADAQNWSDNIVPGAADSVHISNGFLNAPVFPGQVTLRAFVNDATTPTSMDGELTVTERLITTASMACATGEIILAGAANPVRFSGEIACTNVRVLSGTAVPDGRVVVASDLSVWDDALLALNRNTIEAPFFQTIGNGRLRMDQAIDSLIVQAATFGGGSTDGLLTDGVLMVSGNFTQDGNNSPTSFAASGNHTTVFAGNAGDQQSSFANPGEGALTSHFANVEMSKGEAGTSVLLNSAAYALGTLRTGNAVAQRFLLNVTEPRNSTVLFQSHGGDVDGITFSNVKWSILDGRPIQRMDNIAFVNSDSAATQLNIERATGDVQIRAMTFSGTVQEGQYLRLRDLDGDGGGSSLFRVTFSSFTPPSLPLYLLENGALIVGW